MRLGLVLASALIASQAAAHDSAAPIGGEEPVEHIHLSDEIWDLFLPQAEASADITVHGNTRHIHAWLSEQAARKFPNRNNPHAISKKNYNLEVPLNPRKNAEPRDAQGAVFGIAVNGVVMDPGTAEYWQNDRRSGWNYEALGGACQARSRQVQCACPTERNLSLPRHPDRCRLSQRRAIRSRNDRLCCRRFSDLRSVRLLRPCREISGEEACEQLPPQDGQPAKRPRRALQRQIHARLGICERSWRSRPL